MLIAEAIMLLLLDPVSGKPKVDLIRLDTVLGGALTSDFELRGLLKITHDGPFGSLRVIATPGAVLPEDLRDDFLMVQGLSIASAKRRNGPRLVGKLGKDVQTTVLQRFIDQGIIEVRNERLWLNLVTLRRWPMLNTRALEEQQRLVYDAIVLQRTPSADTRAIIALLHCLDVTHRIMPLDDLPRHEVRTRAKAIAGKNWIASAVKALVAAQMRG